MLLGKEVAYPRKYDPSVLHRIARQRNNQIHYVSGFDRWFCYELSFLLTNGCPYCCGLEISFPAESEYIIESKSLKLYLGSFAFERFETVKSCLDKITNDLQQFLGSSNIIAKFIDLKESKAWQTKTLSGLCIDSTDTSCHEFSEPKPDFLEVEGFITEETLHSNIFRSLCPVTSQPDYASILIHYKGPKIKTIGLQRYLVSYRKHNDFHESCCERIFGDLLNKCHCQNLTVACFFTRRGGIEINPVRSTDSAAREDLLFKNTRTLRQ